MAVLPITTGRDDDRRLVRKSLSDSMKECGKAVPIGLGRSGDGFGPILHHETVAVETESSSSKR